MGTHDQPPSSKFSKSNNFIRIMAICGPKCSIFGMLLSVWGVVMLILLGIFLRVHSPAFAEDIGINEEEWKEQNYNMNYVYGLYDQASYNCFIAAALYGGLFVFSFVQHKINARANYTMS